MTTIVPLCLVCKHYIRGNVAYVQCKAFPDEPGIPWKIISGENDHKKPLPEQENEIVFEKRK